MARLFSYVVEHDLGFSPNPFGGYCTLAHCKFSKSGRRNIVELAREDDWVVGTGGASSRSAGHGKLVYAMKVTNKLTLRQYFGEPQLRGRSDNREEDARITKRFALISKDFYYFGDHALRIPARFARHPLEKKGPGFRSDFDESFIHDFEKWIRTKKPGVNGVPCGSQRSARPKRC